jgi:hypothetical protein
MPRRVASGALAPGEIVLVCTRAFRRALGLILASDSKCGKDRGERQMRWVNAPYAPDLLLTKLEPGPGRGRRIWRRGRLGLAAVMGPDAALLTGPKGPATGGL